MTNALIVLAVAAILIGLLVWLDRQDPDR